MKLFLLLVSLAVLARTEGGSDLIEPELITEPELTPSDDPLTTTTTTSAPSSTTSAPSSTTSAPSSTTSAPISTTSSPSTTSAPVSTTSAPIVINLTDAPTSAPASTDYRVCRADAQRFCSSELASGDHSSLCECMSNHVTELTSECQAFVIAKQQERETAREACRSDVMNFCPEAYQQGRWELRRCMMKHYQELSPSCAAYIQRRMDEISPNACDEDVTSFCPTAVGFSATLTCLKEHVSEVSGECLRLLWKPSMNATDGGWGGRDRDTSGVVEGKGRSRHGSWKHGSRKNGEEGSWGRHGSWKRGSWKKHGSWKHGSKKDQERRTRWDSDLLNDNCQENMNTFCPGFAAARSNTYLHDVKQCLARNYVSLDTDCAEYLISSSSSSSYGDDEGRHHRLGKVFVVVAFVVLLTFCCVMRRRCKQRRLWRQMQQNMLPRVQGDTRYIAVPTTAPVLPLTPVTQAQLVPTAPVTTQQPSYNPQGGIVYSPSPYTGGIPINALPVAYNPQAMSVA